MVEYEEFINTKRQDATKSGFSVCESKLNENLFDFQRHIVAKALEHGNYAIFADTGLGKTLMQLSWASKVTEHTGKPVIILTPLAVAGQTIEEGEKFGIQVERLKSDVFGQGIYVLNYEQLKNVDPTVFGGVVLDESSILKNYQGATKTAIIEAFKNTEFRLACTATPAPNDPIEFGNHSEFLGVKKSSQMVSEFFVNDVLSKGRNSKWRLKKHSVRDFYAWVSSWSTVVTSPADIGFEADAEKYKLPPLEIEYTMVDAPKQDNGKLFNDIAVSATQFHGELRKTIAIRCDRAIKIAREHDGQVLLWITSNDEEAYIKEHMPEARIVSGSDKAEKKEEGLLGFAHGKYEYLVTKGKMAKFGLNYQSCQKQIFVSFDFSFEAMYQMIRRSWRFGQKKNVSIDLIYSDTMGNVKQEIQNKQRQFENGKKLMTEMAKQIHTEEVEMGSELEHTTGEGWTLYNADCVEVARSLEENSIDYSFFSPPFADLYTYSGDPRDMSNNATYGKFFDNFQYIVEELLRITKEGRIVSMHCTNMATTLTRDGEIKVIDFRGDLIRFMSANGWLYFGENIIWKDPRPKTQRSKAQNLLHATTKKDSTKNRSCFPDYILHFKKKGDNLTPVNNGGKGLDFAYWGKIAEPVWMDIDAGEVLKTKKTKGDDEKHMTPTQLEPIRRCIDLYSSKGETVFSPFNGVGSEGTIALKKGRDYIGAELKKDYYDLALIELENATMTSNTFLGL